MSDTDIPTLQQENAAKSLRLASALFPNEEWILKEPNIYVAKTRPQNSPKERIKLVWEIDQVRILTNQGSVVYFLPELSASVLSTEVSALDRQSHAHNLLSADTVINGEIVEIKSISGARATLGHEFKKGYKQGASLCRRNPEIQSHSVFIRLFSDLSPGSVKAKIAGELKNRLDPGNLICYFEALGELYSWTYEELRGLIGKK
jgi:hypothetical protein